MSNKNQLELCTDCLQIFIEYSIRDTGVSVKEALTNEKDTLMSGGEILGSMLSGYCLASGATMSEMDEWSPTLEQVMDNLLKRCG